MKNGIALDIGCGSGKYTYWFESTGITCIGLDSSTKALEKASVLRINWVCASATALPFRANLFKTVLIINLLHHFKDIHYHVVLNEMQKTLKQDGWLILDLKNSLNIMLATIYRITNSPFCPMISRHIFNLNKKLSLYGFSLFRTVVIPYSIPLPNVLKYLAPKLLLIYRRIPYKQ